MSNETSTQLIEGRLLYFPCGTRKASSVGLRAGPETAIMDPAGKLLPLRCLFETPSVADLAVTVVERQAEREDGECWVRCWQS